MLLPAGEEDRLSPEEQALFDERQEARRQREFARADAARARLRRWASCSRTPRRARAGGGSAEPASSAGCAGPHRGRRGRGPRLRVPARAAACGSWRGTTAAAPARSTSWPQDGGRVVFVEVKERRGDVARRGGTRRSPSAKRRRVVRAARLYAAAHGLSRRAAALRRGVDRLGAGGPPRAPRRGSLRRELSRARGQGEVMERETGFEPATSTLARSHSTTELFPPSATFKIPTRHARSSSARGALIGRRRSRIVAGRGAA